MVYGIRIDIEVYMSWNHEHEALVERLRAELMEAEEKFRQATTPDSKTVALGLFSKALDRYSRLVLDGELPKE